MSYLLGIKVEFKVQNKTTAGVVIDVYNEDRAVNEYRENPDDRAKMSIRIPKVPINKRHVAVVDKHGNIYKKNYNEITIVDQQVLKLISEN